LSAVVNVLFLEDILRLNNQNGGKGGGGTRVLREELAPRMSNERLLSLRYLCPAKYKQRRKQIAEWEVSEFRSYGVLVGTWERKAGRGVS